LTDNWQHNLNFWTAGTRQGCKGQWAWCGSGVGFSEELVWEKGQPDDKGGREDCIHMRFVLNSTGTILSDRNCTSKLIYACEVILKFAWNPSFFKFKTNFREFLEKVLNQRVKNLLVKKKIAPKRFN